MTPRNPAPRSRPRATALVCVLALLLQAILPAVHRAAHAWSTPERGGRGVTHVAGGHSGAPHDNGAAQCAVCQLLNASRNVLGEVPDGPKPLPLPRVALAQVAAVVAVVPLRNFHPAPRGPPALPALGLDRSC